MDALILEAVAATGCAALAIAARRRSAPPRRAREAPIPSVRRAIRELPHRHRRAARAVADLANLCLSRHPAGSYEAFTATETLRAYLPETIAAYLAVPAGYRRERRAGRPSADDELRQQLRTLAAGLARIMEADAAAGISRLATNGARGARAIAAGRRAPRVWRALRRHRLGFDRPVAGQPSFVRPHPYGRRARRHRRVARSPARRARRASAPDATRRAGPRPRGTGATSLRPR